ncbi:WYL domain-containing protein [Hamadaea sp. NPDC051192]|uniref:helix-turn-helix transcriptional regulator n=1 Tax=Hamadaea sp. NPDC051192 TaxID=3154940 RepID=UPI00342A12D1
MLETSVRLLRLLALLQSRRDWSGAELSARLEVTGRTVRNDVERLRILGYEIHSSTGITGGYRLSPGKTVPPLLLDDEEAVAVAVGLSAAAAGSVAGIEEPSVRALAKLQQTLPTRLRGRVDAVRRATVFAAGGGPAVDPQNLTIVAAAIRDHERLRFDYTGHSGDTTRTVEPQRLVYTGQRWYLLAWDLDRDDWRTFRADRITPRPPAGPRFTPRELTDEEATDRVRRGVGSLAWPYQAEVRLHAPAAALAGRIPPEAGLLVPIDEQTCLFQTGTGSLLGLVTFVTKLGVGFTAVNPPELRELLSSLATTYAAAAEPPRE